MPPETVAKNHNGDLIDDLASSILNTKRELLYLKDKEKQETKELKHALITNGMIDFLQINFRKLARR